jgi:two-component sensor histidine kinase
MSEQHDDHGNGSHDNGHDQASARPSEMRLQSDRPAVTRLSRKVLLGLGGVAAVAIAGALFFALRSHSSNGGSELYNTSSRSTPEGLSVLPHDYTGLPQTPRLGPPLPGDLGKPIHDAGVSSPGMPMPGGGTPEQQRLAQERDAARTSHLFATTNSVTSVSPVAAVTPSAAAASASAAATADTTTDHKLAFLDQPADRQTENPDRLQDLISPSSIMAGTIIPAALITGLRSDLPGEITAQVTQDCYDSPTGRLLLTPLVLLDGNLIVIAASKSFCRAFQIERTAIEGRPLSEIGRGEWNKPQLLSLLKATASNYAEVEDYEMDLERPDLGDRHLIINAHRLEYGDGDNTRLLLAVSDTTVARMAEKLKDALLKVKDDLLKDKAVLLQELHHRVANSLQIIASVLMQSARKVQSEETKGHLFNAHQRVMSVAALQRQLTSSEPGDVALRPYFAALCESISASMIRDRDKISLTVSVDESKTSADVSVSLGLIVTELVINALKHAFPGDSSGTIIVDYHSRGPNWVLSVSDTGVGMPKDAQAAKAGLGTNIVQALASQLQATIKVSDAYPGTAIRITHARIATVDAVPLRAI